MSYDHIMSYNHAMSYDHNMSYAILGAYSSLMILFLCAPAVLINLEQVSIKMIQKTLKCRNEYFLLSQ